MAKRKNVLPGFNLSLGYTLLYLSLIVLIPLSAAFIRTTELSWEQFWATVTAPRVVASRYWKTLRQKPRKPLPALAPIAGRLSAG